MANDNFRSTVLTKLNCLTSTSDTEHLCNNPIELSCGHNICKNCLQSINHTIIKCNICNTQINNTNLSQIEKPKGFSSLITANINELFQVTFKKFENILETYRETICEYDERIDRQIEFVRENITIRIESIKIELENIHESLNNKLNQIKEKWNRDIAKIKFSNNFEDFEISLKQLEENIEKREHLNKQNLYKYDKQIRQIQDALQKYENGSPQLEFRQNEVNIKADLIGELIFEPNGSVDKTVMKRIKQNRCKQIYYPHTLWDLCELPNGNVLISTSSAPVMLLVYNANMEYMSQISKINGKSYNVTGITCDENNNVYMCTFSSNCVLKTDSNFSQLALFGTGTAGTGLNQVNNPTGICYYNQYVYVCDYENKRVQKLDSNLTLKATYSLKYYPWYIKNIKNVAIIRPTRKVAIYFYDLNTFSMLKKYEGHNGIIGASKKYFYEYYSSNKKFYCYKSNGEIFEEIDANFDESNGSYGCICVTKSNLISASPNMNLLNVF